MNCFQFSPCRRPPSNSCLPERTQSVAPAYWQMTFENMTSQGHVSVCILQDKPSMDPISPPPPGGTQLISQRSDCESCCWVPALMEFENLNQETTPKCIFTSLFSGRALHQRSHVSLLIYLPPTCLLQCLCALGHQPAPPNPGEASNNHSWDQVSTFCTSALLTPLKGAQRHEGLRHQKHPQQPHK